jgi:hypothetical protein
VTSSTAIARRSGCPAPADGGEHATRDYRGRRTVPGGPLTGITVARRRPSGKAQTVPPARDPPMPHIEDRATYRDALRVFRREVHALFQHPEAAREEILYSLTFWGCEYTCATLRASPYKFGPVRTEAEFEQHARTADAACRYEIHRKTRVRRVLVAAAQALRDADDALAWESIVRACGEASRAAQSELARAVARRCAARAAVRAFRKTATRVFECPRAAVRRIYDYCMACGVDAAVRALDEMPQVFGTLRACQADFGLRGVPSLSLTFTTYAPARTSAQTLA